MNNEKKLIANLESIIEIAQPGKRETIFSSLPFGIFQFIQIFNSNMSDKQLNEVLEKTTNLITLISMDYYLRMGGNVTANSKFVKLSTDDEVEYFADLLKDKKPNYYNRKDEFIFTLPSVRTGIVSSLYLNLLSNQRSKALIAKASNLNDLKAIIIIDKILPLLKYNKVNEILESDLNPEQIFIALAKIKYGERGLKDFDKYFGMLKSFSEDVKRLINDKPSENSAEKLFELEKKIQDMYCKFKHFKDDEAYDDTVGRFFDIKGQAISSIIGYVDEHIADLLNSINPDFEASQDLEKDFEISDANFSRYYELRKYCSLFRRNIAVNDLESKLKKRNFYLIEARNTKIELTRKNSAIGKYLEYIGGIKMKPLTQKLAKWILSARQDVQQIPKEFDKWKEDHYLGKDVQKFVAECNKCGGGLEAYIRSQTIDAMETINLGFELTDSLDADLNLSSQNLARYRQVKQCYEWIGQDVSSLEKKEKDLIERHSYLSKVIEVKKQLEEKLQTIMNYKNELDKIQNAA